jgi:hypothetical protein
MSRLTVEAVISPIQKYFLVNDQRDAQFFTMYLFLFLTLYMFRAHRAHHQERQIAYILKILSCDIPVVFGIIRWCKWWRQKKN